MIEVNIVYDKKKMELAQAMLSEIKNGFPKAVSRAINRTATNINVQASKLIKKEYTIKNKTKGVVTRATTSRLAGNINYRGRPRLLRQANFSVGMTKNGISAKVERSSGRKVIPRTFIRALRTSAAPGVMQRKKGVPRYPVKVLYGPSLPQMAGNVNVQPEVEKFIQKKMDERLNHEVDALLKGYAK